MEKEGKRNGSYERDIRTRFGKIKDLGVQRAESGVNYPLIIFA